MRLSRLIHVVNREFPNYVHSLPSPDEIDIVKLGKGGAITTCRMMEVTSLRRPSLVRRRVRCLVLVLSTCFKQNTT